MTAQGDGRIVHISSKAAVVGEPGHVAYSASVRGLADKGTVLSLTRAMAGDFAPGGRLAPHSITVNAVCPGPVVCKRSGDMLLAGLPDAASRQALAQKAPLGRLGQPAVAGSGALPGVG